MALLRNAARSNAFLQRKIVRDLGELTRARSRWISEIAQWIAVLFSPTGARTQTTP